jgi:hypothetical protein
MGGLRESTPIVFKKKNQNNIVLTKKSQWARLT